ncbi:hypothetical protein H2200_009074 [Cladophialophora chaetospira]|uniref:Uncharacterized protein n=1 Tax=Cladophialophora chaetospira TaxID=386627 RepID=A0AA39CF15_9EURO|nr:hypothetical protein H2200_009074 [Cladophialophora chaetospira]
MFYFFKTDVTPPSQAQLFEILGDDEDDFENENEDEDEDEDDSDTTEDSPEPNVESSKEPNLGDRVREFIHWIEAYPVKKQGGALKVSVQPEPHLTLRVKRSFSLIIVTVLLAGKLERIYVTTSSIVPPLLLR